MVNFLAGHRFLLALLQDANDSIQSYFDSYHQLVLEVVAEPEAIDDRELVLFIQTDLPAAEALDSLHRLDRRWW